MLDIQRKCSIFRISDIVKFHCGIEKGQAIARGRRISEGRAGPAAAAVPHTSGCATGQPRAEREICHGGTIAAIAKRPFDLRHKHQLCYLHVAAGKTEIIGDQPIGLRRHNLCVDPLFCKAE